jgi:hypothetical protein
MAERPNPVLRSWWAVSLLAGVLGSGCTGEPDLDELWAGRWEVVEHEQAPECDGFGPASPEWSAFELAFIDLEGFLGLTVARCEGGCDTPNAAVILDIVNEERLEGLDTETGLFDNTAGEVCQASLIEVVASRKGDALSLDLRSFFGALTPPNDGDCERLVSDVSDQLCDEALRFEAVR